MNKYKKIILATALIGLIGMSLFSYKIYNTFFGANTRFQSEKLEIKIPTTATYKEVYNILAPALDDPESFHATAVQKGYPKYIKPGRYILTKGMSNNDIINCIRSQNTPIKLRFNNQERLEDLAGRIAQQIEPDSLSILNALKDENFLKKQGFTAQNAISMYLPNSYEMYWNTSATAFRKRMLNAYNQFWNEKRLEKARALQLTEEEVIALASIVHKETAMADERARVAGVYVNRLKKRIKLDADPTVIYAKKLHDNDFQQVIKRVLYKDLELDSKYNTYKHAGVPPGPIVTPDLNAIDAVLNYEKHNYYYFVASTERFGYHKFAKSLSQHNANAVAYRKWVSNQGINR